MKGHAFLFHPGKWLGEGKVSFTTSPEHVPIYLKWDVGESGKQGIPSSLHVQLSQPVENRHNHYTIVVVDSDAFKIFLKNDLFGEAEGVGEVTPEKIRWEFQEEEGLCGFEEYTLQPDGGYLLHAEYGSPDQFGTIINARIWKKEDSR